MFRIASAITLLGVLALLVPAAPPAPLVFQGHVKDVRGTNGILTLVVKQDNQVRSRQFSILDARAKGPTGTEWKIGDLRPGDRVEVELVADGRTVRVIRVLPAQKVR
jgi:hypothetical protein